MAAGLLNNYGLGANRNGADAHFFAYQGEPACIPASSPHTDLMGSTSQPRTLTADQVSELNHRLTEMRHNVNNDLALIIAAAELARHKPESVARFLPTFSDQPGKIAEEIRKFSDQFETTFGIESKRKSS